MLFAYSTPVRLRSPPETGVQLPAGIAVGTGGSPAVGPGWSGAGSWGPPAISPPQPVSARASTSGMLRRPMDGLLPLADEGRGRTGHRKLRGALAGQVPVHRR